MHLSKRKIFAATLLAAMACGASSQTLRIGLFDDPDTLDPSLGRVTGGMQVLKNVCDRLLVNDGTGGFQPQLATSYEWSSDRRTLTLKLRSGVKFHDGEAFDADAVKYNLERNMTLQGSGMKVALGGISGVEIVDPLTVRIQLKEPAAQLLLFLADRPGTIISPKAGRAAGDKFGNHPVCAGPFKFVERIPQGRILLERFEQYWNRQDIKLKRVEYYPVIDSTVRLANLQSGQLDLIEGVAATDFKRMRSEKTVKTASARSDGYFALFLNLSDSPEGKALSDPRVREALDLAIDRETLVKVVFDGLYTPGNQWVSPNSPYYLKSVAVPKRNVERAKQLLKDAGKPNLSFTLIVPPDRDRQEAAQVIQSMLADVGVNMKLETKENVAMLRQAIDGKAEAVFSFWTGKADPDGNIIELETCGRPLNFGRYCNKEVDALLYKARTVTDLSERKPLYDQAAAMWLRDRPKLVLWYPELLYVISSKVNGFKAMPDGTIDLRPISLN